MRIKILGFACFVIAPLLLNAQKDSIPAVSKLLSLSLEELMNLKVVTASGYMETAAEAPSTITVINAQQIAERGYEQLEDALRDIPGIDMIHINGYAPTLIYFRGMYGAENLRALLMIDGIVENNILGTNDMAGPAYSLHNVARIEIIWGPVSALYGANAFGGVINIITKKGGDINGLHAEQGFGSFNTTFTNVMMGLKKSKFEFDLSGSIYSSNGANLTVRDPEYSGSYVDKAYSLNTTISYLGKKSKTSLGFRTYRTPIGWGTYSNTPTVYLGLPAPGNGNSGLLGVLSRDFRGEKPGRDDSFLRTWFVQHEWKASDKLNLSARFTYRETGTAEDSYIYITANGSNMLRVKVATFSNQVSGEFAANYLLSQKEKISAGIEFYQDNVEAGQRGSTFDPTVYIVDGRDTVTDVNSHFLPRNFDIRNNFGSYAQYILNTNFLHKTSFTGGLRYDHNSYFGDAVSPRLAIVNQLSDQLTFKVQLGTAFRAPSNLEIHQTPPSGNFQLKQEKIKTYEVNAIYSPSKKVQFQVNGFRNDLSDVIVLANLSGLVPDKNPGVIHVTGLETVLNVEMATNLTGFVNFTYQDARGENLVTQIKGKVPGVAKVKGNIGITSHIDDLFIINLSGNWVGKRPTPRTDPYGPVAGYFLTNCVISTEKLFNSTVTASFEVRNLFNVKWMDPGFRTADGFVYATALPQPGLTGLIKIGVSL